MESLKSMYDSIETLRPKFQAAFSVLRRIDQEISRKKVYERGEKDSVSAYYEMDSYFVEYRFVFKDDIEDNAAKPGFILEGETNSKKAGYNVTIEYTITFEDMERFDEWYKEKVRRLQELKSANDEIEIERLRKEEEKDREKLMEQYIELKKKLGIE